jgi:hypothetical protein
MTADHHLFEFLTREEWRMCYALQFLNDWEEYADAFDIDRFATPGTEGRPESYEESFRRAIRFLALGHGFTFTSLQCLDSGEIYGEPIEERNLLYVNLLATGGSPDIPGCLRELLAKAPSSVTSEPIREAIEEIEQVVRHIEATAPKDVINERLKAREVALASWGVEVAAGGGIVH